MVGQSWPYLRKGCGDIHTITVNKMWPYVTSPSGRIFWLLGSSRCEPFTTKCAAQSGGNSRKHPQVRKLPAEWKFVNVTHHRVEFGGSAMICLHVCFEPGLWQFVTILVGDLVTFWPHGWQKFCKQPASHAFAAPPCWHVRNIDVQMHASERLPISRCMPFHADTHTSHTYWRKFRSLASD